MNFDSLALVEQKEIVKKALQAYVASRIISAGALYSVGTYDWMVYHGYIDQAVYPDSVEFWYSHLELKDYVTNLWSSYIDAPGEAVSGGLRGKSIWSSWKTWALIAAVVFVGWWLFIRK